MNNLLVNLAHYQDISPSFRRFVYLMAVIVGSFAGFVIAVLR